LKGESEARDFGEPARKDFVFYSTKKQIVERRKLGLE
jgi:hypothetical protein